MVKILFIVLFALVSHAAWATEADVYCLTGTKSDGTSPAWAPASSSKPCPTAATTSPLGVTSTNLSSTIASTGVFQSVQAATSTRKGCTIQNLGTHNMNVFFGTIGSATTGNSVQLVAGSSVQCVTDAGGVLTDQVSITGTTGDAFFANFQ